MPSPNNPPPSLPPPLGEGWGTVYTKATFDIIDPLIQAGYLPTFERIMARGARGPLMAWPNMNSAAAWTSITTGYNPGKRNIFHLHKLDRKPGEPQSPTTGSGQRQ